MFPLEHQTMNSAEVLFVIFVLKEPHSSKQISNVVIVFSFYS
jgi:hypothetical protein